MAEIHKRHTVALCGSSEKLGDGLRTTVRSRKSWRKGYNDQDP
jgi:hypothetical protein